MTFLTVLDTMGLGTILVGLGGLILLIMMITALITQHREEAKIQRLILKTPSRTRIGADHARR